MTAVINGQWRVSGNTLDTLVVALLVLLLCAGATTVRAQTETATISGLVTDETGSVVPGTEVKLQSVERGTVQSATTNNSGIYVFASVQPGQFQITVQKAGFRQVDFLGLIVNVQDHVEQNFRLQLGSVSESVTVEANALNVNTESAAVGTIVDRQFVANIPLNGRSLQSLIAMVPGVSVVPNGGVGQQGEFSVNGQRSEENYFMVDGVSANTGAAAGSTLSGGPSGSVPAETALGTTQSMISLDALQEFRATTSSYSAEYGRTPGGQFSFVSRSGTNDWHGSLFDYFRNEALDANNWFSDALGMPKTPERQNDFGGTLGGPLRIPGLYNGKDKTFFFFSYEGLRLQQPAGGETTQYPDVALRQNAPAALQPFLNAFPIPNGAEVLDANGQPTGLALFTAAYSNPSDLDALSIRIDHNVTGTVRIFGRYSQSTSSTNSRPVGFGDLAQLNSDQGTVNSLTFGVTATPSPRVSDEFRFNYTRNDQSLLNRLDGFGGAQPVNIDQVAGFGGTSPSEFSLLGFGLDIGGGDFWDLGNFRSAQRQWNVTNAFTISARSHTIKLGVDYRRLSTIIGQTTLEEEGFFTTESGVLQNTPSEVFAAASPVPPEPIFTNLSLYVQDEWKATQRLSLSLGLRWDLNPPPQNGNDPQPYTLNQIADLSTAQLAPRGAPLWRSDYHAFAPRLGAAYVLRQSAGSESVIRGGFGIFYDTGNTLASQGFNEIGFGGDLIYNSVPFPLTPAELAIPPASVAPPYNNKVTAFDPNLTLPYTMEWNLAIEQTLGRNQALTVSYVGSGGRHELFETRLFPPYPNFSSNNGLALVTANANSEYNALQVQLQKRLSHGLQFLVSYTWSHSIDDGSTNFFVDQLLRGSSDFDIRHNFQTALTYDFPGNYSNPMLSAILKHWGLDSRISARSGLPVDILDGTTALPNGQQINLRPDLVPGVPIYLHGSQYPGGRILNFNAFQADPSGGQGNLPRNMARDFGWVQLDFALRRDFPIKERLHLQFRAEAFNIFNHPNFTNIDNNLGDGPYQVATVSGFGGAQSSPNNFLGGINALYQVGGPRSLQLALKLQF